MGYSKKDLVIETAQGRLYDYIANHYWEMSKEDLKEVLLAVIGTGLDSCLNDDDENDYAKAIIGELESRYFGIDDDEEERD